MIQPKIGFYTLTHLFILDPLQRTGPLLVFLKIWTGEYQGNIHAKSYFNFCKF
jgi:hypothetical protein